MKALAVLAVAVFGAIGIVGLADLTQNRPDPVEEGSATVVTFDVDTRDCQRGDDAAAQAPSGRVLGDGGRRRQRRARARPGSCRCRLLRHHLPRHR